ncbi:uncharacterized protein LOC131947101 [Physella acuta]|uniref:uncharacterized protein LOC131947101 n=1 Tax=Physella acuta TaxID=109671 RepID=UPI0027DDB9A5|nr:uncharacterized protein LOC131947101 [Physella acuta]
MNFVFFLFVPLFFASLARDVLGKFVNETTVVHKRSTIRTQTDFPIPYTHEIRFETALFPVFTIEGRPDNRATRFTIEMCADRPCLEIRAFQFSARFDKRQVVRSHKLGRTGDWSRQETNGLMPFTRGKSFKIKITTNSGKYKVYVDGNFFCDYKFAVPLHTIKFIKIADQVNINKLTEQIINPILSDQRFAKLSTTRPLKAGDVIHQDIEVHPDIWSTFENFQLNLYESTNDPEESKRHVVFLYRKDGTCYLSCSNVNRECPMTFLDIRDSIFAPFTFSYEVSGSVVKAYFNREYKGEVAVSSGAQLDVMYFNGRFSGHTVEFVPSL